MRLSAGVHRSRNGLDAERKGGKDKTEAEAADDHNKEVSSSLLEDDGKLETRTTAYHPRDCVLQVQWVGYP